MLATSAKINKQALIEIQKNIQQNSPHPKEIKIIAVTKTFSIKSIDSAIQNKIYHIGENKVQEAEQKTRNYKERKKIKLHLIGTLQSNKAKKAVRIFDYIETVDREKIARKINQEAKKINKKQRIFLQINVGEDTNKQGLLVKNINKISLIIKTLKNIEVVGIMTILPQKTTKNQRIEFYREIKTIQQKINKKYFSKCLFTSMGMSKDYKEALVCGATHIRIGTLLYEQRKK